MEDRRSNRRLATVTVGYHLSFLLYSPNLVAVTFSPSVEHIVAIKHGGSDDPSNLCLACERCNLFKGSDLTGFDSVTGMVERLFNPREQSWADHFELQGR